jgi:hypothetical protein
VKAFKGFTTDMQCRGFQFEQGKTYEHDGPVKACGSGFHACESPLDVFAYYPPGTSIFHEVVLGGDMDRDEGGDSKVAASKLTVGARIGLPGLAEAHVEYVRSRVDEGKPQTKVGDTASNTGDYSAASVEGRESVAIVTGKDSKAAGADTCWIVLTERDDNYNIIEVRAVKVGSKVGRTTIKPGVFYTLRGGKVVKAS